MPDSPGSLGSRDEKWSQSLSAHPGPRPTHRRVISHLTSEENFLPGNKCELAISGWIPRVKIQRTRVCVTSVDREDDIAGWKARRGVTQEGEAWDPQVLGLCVHHGFRRAAKRGGGWRRGAGAPIQQGEQQQHCSTTCRESQQEVAPVETGMRMAPAGGRGTLLNLANLSRLHQKRRLMRWTWWPSCRALVFVSIRLGVRIESRTMRRGPGGSMSRWSGGSARSPAPTSLPAGDMPSPPGSSGLNRLSHFPPSLVVAFPVVTLLPPVQQFHLASALRSREGRDERSRSRGAFALEGILPDGVRLLFVSSVKPPGLHPPCTRSMKKALAWTSRSSWV